MSTTPAEKLVTARCRLMLKDPWYGHMMMSIEWCESEMSWIKDPEQRSMGVKIASNGAVKISWYADWVASRTITQLYGAIEHTINHLVRMHTFRQSDRHKEAWAIATDMAVNGKKDAPFIGYRETGGHIIMPCTYDVTKGEDVWTIPNYEEAKTFSVNKGGKLAPTPGGMIFVPDEWQVSQSAEYYYTQILKSAGEQQPSPGGKSKGQGQKPGQGQGQGKGQGQGQPGQGQTDEEGEEGQGEGEGEGQSKHSPEYEYGKFSGNGIDNHETWDQTDIAPDEARQVINDMVREAQSKSQGYVPGHLSEAIKELGKPIVRWREILRRVIGNYVGGRRKTLSRVNRRYDQWGLKGISHHAAANVSVIIDTSGSVGTKELEQFFAEIEAISYKANIHVLQWDAAFQGFDRYRKGDWKKLKVKGRGGTDMAAPVAWLEENGHVANLTILLTDGYCNWPAPRNYPMVFVITGGQGEVALPEWGTVIRMTLDDKGK